MKIPIIFLFLCCHWNILRADNTENRLEKNLILSNIGEDLAFTPPVECTLLLDSFANYASIFTKCSIEFARPVRLCERCIDHYVNFRDKYKELMNDTTCKSIYISNDRLDVVLDYHNSILAVWEKGQCNACFDWNNLMPILSNTTKNFNKMFNETMTCIYEAHPTINNTEEVCQKCMLNYLQLDDYYKSLSSDSIGVYSICMDIVDSMNTTRSIWSKTLGCCKLRKSPETMFLACSGIISILPFLYYIAVRFCGPIRDLPNVLKQSRFKQRLLRTGNRRIN